MIKNPPANRGEADSIPGLGRSPGEGMASHSCVLPWRIPWTEEPGGLSSMGSQRITSWVSWSFQIILSPILIQRNKGGNCEINSSPWQRMKTTYTSRMRFNVISSRKCLHLFSPLLWNPVILSTVIPWYPQGLGSRTISHTQICRYSVQSLSGVRLFVTPWTAAHQASPSITNCQSPPKLMSIELVMPSNHLILCCPLLLPSIFPSIRVFSNESALRIRWPKYWSFSFNISPSNEHSGVISVRMDCLDLLSVQGTLKSLLQHHNSKASIQRSAFFTVQLSHPYMTTGKTIPLTRRTFVDKVMSLLLNMLSRLVITFLPRSKRLLISWLQSPSAVILEPPKIRVSHCFPIYLPWSDGTGCYDLSFLNGKL